MSLRPFVPGPPNKIRKVGFFATLEGPYTSPSKDIIEIEFEDMAVGYMDAERFRKLCQEEDIR